MAVALNQIAHMPTSVYVTNAISPTQQYSAHCQWPASINLKTSEPQGPSLSFAPDLPKVKVSEDIALPCELKALGHSPIKVNVTLNYLDSYPDKQTAHELKIGLQFGFPLHYTGPRSGFFCNNLLSAKTHAKQFIKSFFTFAFLCGGVTNFVFWA